MQTIIYDTSFEGFLTAVFEIYEYRFSEPDIQKDGAANISLFGDVHYVETNADKVSRVIKTVTDKITPVAFRNLYKTFLSELKGIENVMFRYVQYVIKTKDSIERDFSNEAVLTINQTAHKVDHEKHRMKAFIRFQKTKDELYYAIIQPDYNVLPLISKHFKDRYADQRWLIYDVHRKYGLYYDKHVVSEVSLNFTNDLNTIHTKENVYDEQEDLYQSLWQTYFSSVNIKARKNMKLHIQHMPKRYWKYLTEKQLK